MRASRRAVDVVVERCKDFFKELNIFIKEILSSSMGTSMVYRKKDLETSIISKNTQEALGDRFYIREQAIQTSAGHRFKIVPRGFEPLFPA
jgi:hypothetical protein